MDAFTLLEKDHRKVEHLLERYRKATSKKSVIVREITHELSAHMDAEERELYPVLRTAIEDGQSLMQDALKEHREARGLLAELATGEEGSFDMDAKVATLMRAIDHHVKDEEQEIFPKARKSLTKASILEIGSRIARAKKVAPKSPPPSAARNSPGASVGGMVVAATDRVKNLLVPPDPRESRGPSRRRSAKPQRKRAVMKSRARKRATSNVKKAPSRAGGANARKRVARKSKG